MVLGITNTGHGFAVEVVLVPISKILLITVSCVEVAQQPCACLIDFHSGTLNRGTSLSSKTPILKVQHPCGR